MNDLTYSATLRKLRPPYTQTARVVYGYSLGLPTNLGLTLEVPLGSALTAPGDGTIDLITPAGALWRNDLGATRMLAVRIDHGHGIKTWVHGLGAAVVGYGPVTRGQLLGQAANTQIFFGFERSGKLVDPTHLNANFQVQDGFLQSEEKQSVRHAPDLITRVLTTIGSLLSSGVTYLLPPSPEVVRFNLDFNGDGTKIGAAVTGTSADQWQVIDPLDFAEAVAYGPCAGAKWYPAEQGLFLTDWRGRRTRVYLTRVELTADAGVVSTFDSMLNTWTGGFTGITPKLNSFTIRNLPRGTYRLYAYAVGDGSGADLTSITLTGAGLVGVDGVYNQTSVTQYDHVSNPYTILNFGGPTWFLYNPVTVVEYSTSNFPYGPWSVDNSNPPAPTVTPAGAIATVVYCGVDGNAPTSQNLDAITTTTFVETDNYVVFDNLVVSNKGQLSIQVYGFLSGIQLERISA